jgi:hypothetical protein
MARSFFLVGAFIVRRFPASSPSLDATPPQLSLTFPAEIDKQSSPLSFISLPIPAQKRSPDHECS